jgi:hypothetical protein
MSMIPTSGYDENLVKTVIFLGNLDWFLCHSSRKQPEKYMAHERSISERKVIIPHSSSSKYFRSPEQSKNFTVFRPENTLKVRRIQLEPHQIS